MATSDVWRSHPREHEQSSQSDVDEKLAKGLGWFSIGLGLAELVAPDKVARFIGVQDDDSTQSLLRFYGLREVAAGVGILSQPRPAGWLWGRVAGDLLDLATLGSALASSRSEHGKVTAATAAVLGVTALDIYCAQQLSRNNGQTGARESSLVPVRKSVSINRSPEEVYSFWRDFTNLPRFMTYLESVQVSGDGRSHWTVKGPGGKMIEWDAEITEERPNELIAWKSVEGSDVYHSGHVHFERAPADRGTRVRVHFEYAPPGGAISAKLAKLLGSEPGQQVDTDLRAFKQVMETGEVVKSDASIHRGMHPAQPAEEVQG